MSPAGHPRLPEPIQGVLLDAGGTLVDLDLDYLRRLVSRHRDVELDGFSRAEALARREIERLVTRGASVGDNWREFFRFLLRSVHVPVAQWDGLIDSLWEAHQRVGLWTVPVAGATGALAALREGGLRLAVVSNAEGQIARDLERAGLGPFDAVIDSHVVGVEKPDPEIFRIALKRLELPAERVVHVGDLPSVDLAGAAAAGIAAILVDPHGLYPEADAPRVASVAELPGLLL